MGWPSDIFLWYKKMQLIFLLIVFLNSAKVIGVIWKVSIVACHMNWPYFLSVCLKSQMFVLCTDHSCGIYWSLIAFWKLLMHSQIFIYQACHPPISNTNRLDIKWFLPCSSNQCSRWIYGFSVGGNLHKFTGFCDIFIYVF